MSATGYNLNAALNAAFRGEGPAPLKGPAITTITRPTYGRVIPEHAKAEGQELLMADPKYRRMAENLFYAKARPITNADINEIVKHVALQANLDKAMKEHGIGFKPTQTRRSMPPRQQRAILATETHPMKPAPPRGLGMLPYTSEFVYPNSANNALPEPLMPTTPKANDNILNRVNTSGYRPRPLRGPSYAPTVRRGPRLFKPITPSVIAEQLSAYVAPSIKTRLRRKIGRTRKNIESAKPTQRQSEGRAKRRALLSGRTRRVSIKSSPK